MARKDKQLAALRAFLALEPEEAQRLTKQLVQTDDVDGYGELVYAAFVTAVRRRFPPKWRVPDVIRFVATARARLVNDVIEIDPRTAEAMVRRALGDGIASELDEEASARAQIFLLGELIVDENLDDAGLDEFLVEARTLADHLIT